MIFDSFKGMDNRQKDESIPDGFLRNAVNVQFDQLGKPKRVDGVTKVYSGSGIHSYWNRYFIEGSNLKRLNDDLSVTTIGSVGPERMGFVSIGDRIYCANGFSGYLIKNDIISEWGVKNPENSITLSARDTGGMFAGDYQVVITHIRNGEESGCGKASLITLTDGQGIYATIPTPPADINEIGVYVSSTNGDEFFLYGEYDSSATDVFIDSNISSIRLETQFCYQPIPSDILAAHYGRIYWAEGPLLRYTEAQKYGYTKAENYARFGSDITLIASVPGALYVCADKTYRISNIDLQGFMVRTEVFPYGAVKGSLRYDERSKTAFWKSHKGIVGATIEGAQELVANSIAMPIYTDGTMTLTENNGIRQLISVCTGGSETNLMDQAFKASEILRKGKAL